MSEDEYTRPCRICGLPDPVSGVGCDGLCLNCHDLKAENERLRERIREGALAVVECPRCLDGYVTTTYPEYETCSECGGYGVTWSQEAWDEMERARTARAAHRKKARAELEEVEG